MRKGGLEVGNAGQKLHRVDDGGRRRTRTVPIIWVEAVFQ